jgi:hypothetical protein
MLKSAHGLLVHCLARNQGLCLAFAASAFSPPHTPPGSYMYFQAAPF